LCITATLSAILIAPVLSAANDLCLDASEGNTPTENNPIVIGRAFKTPKRNRCKAFQGVIAGEQSSVTGVACTSFDNDHVSFTLTETASNGAHRGVKFYSTKIQLASASGSFRINSIGDGEPTRTRAVSVYDCTGLYPDNL